MLYTVTQVVQSTRWTDTPEAGKVGLVNELATIKWYTGADALVAATALLEAMNHPTSEVVPGVITMQTLEVKVTIQHAGEESTNV